MVTNKPRWGVGSNQYAKRPGLNQPVRPPALSRPLVGDDAERREAQLEDTGITWSTFDVSPIKPSGLDRARARFRAQLPTLIWNDARLEGNAFTLPEVRTLLDGVTVGGRPTSDEQQILALSEGYNALDEMVRDHTFALTKETSDRIHSLVAVHEAIESGHFRGEGSAQGGGNVRLANGGSVAGTPHGPQGVDLLDRFDALTATLERDVDDPRARALIYFAAATRTQFYFDGNKRTARLMMAGMLMSNGYDAINIPYARKLEFNTALDTMFTTNNATPLLNFLATCTID